MALFLWGNGFDVGQNRERVCQFLDELEGSTAEHGYHAYKAEAVFMTWVGDLRRREGVDDVPALIGKAVRDGLESWDIKAAGRLLDRDKLIEGELIPAHRYSVLLTNGEPT